MKNRLVKTFLTLLLLPLIYFSAVRLISQFIAPTDLGSLWATPSPSLSSVSRLCRLDPLSADYKTFLARSLVDQNDPDAGKAIRSAVAVSPVNSEGWVLSGKLSGSQGKIDRGLKAFEKALSLNPGRPSIYLERGLYLFDALPSFSADRRPFYRGLAELSLNLGLSLDHAVSVNPRFCLAAASILAEKEETGAAVFWLRRTMLSPPVDWPFAVRKLALCFTLDQRVEAVSSWRKIFLPKDLSAVRIQAISSEVSKYSNPDFAYMRADIDLFQARFDAAQKELSSLVALRPNVADYRIALGNVYEKLGRSNEARLSYEKALELSPANQEAKRKVTEYYAKQHF